MQPSARRETQGQSSGVSGEFFIPDLCAPRPVLFMVILTELMVMVYVLISSSLPRFDWDLLATCSLFVQWVVLLSAAGLCQFRSIFSRLDLQWATTGSLMLVGLITLFSSLVMVKLYPQLVGGIHTPWLLLRNTLVALVLAGIVLRYFYLQQQLQLREKMELQARLDSLRARIRPHFLFNTMNSIASLISTRPEAAEQAVEDLSELFRSSLQTSHRSTTVTDELRLCELYLGIEALRLGDRLRVNWQVEDGLNNELMPSLILQPLLENAVYHGISRLPKGGVIGVVVGRSGDQIRISVDNPIPDRPVQADGLHMAMTNIEERLMGLYGPRASLEVRQQDGNYRVDLSYPLAGAL